MISFEPSPHLSIIFTFPKIFSNVNNLKLISIFKNILGYQRHELYGYKSPLTNLITMEHYIIIKSFSNNHQTDVTDFEKDFDRDNHELLPHKLHKIGFVYLLLS